MLSAVDITELVIFISYCILSLIVFQLYVKNAGNLKSLQVTSVVILTAMFLMFCALTHVSALWGGRGHRALTFICGAVSSATAVVTLNLRSTIDETLTNRFRAVKLVKDDTILDLMKGYSLNINVENNTIVSGTVDGVPILHPRHLSSSDTIIDTGSMVDVNGKKFRIIHKIHLERNDNTSFCLFGVDVTEEFKNQQLVQKTNQKQLALCISTAHEIRTPLTSMLYLSKNLRGHPDAPCVIVDELFAHIQLLQLVATNMMEAGRILGGDQLVPTLSQINMRDVFARMKLLAQYIHDVNVECSFHVESSVPELFVSDEEWFWQIFLSFMTTALKYTSSGYVKSNCGATMKNGTMFITLTVTDSGIGITEEDRSQLFEMFVDLRTHTESNKGVGLYTVKKKIGILGGFCSIIPNTDKTVKSGSIFQATFPVGEEDLEEEREVRCKSLSSIKSILVVDDTSTIILVMKRALKDHHVDIAHNGKEALDLMLQKEYDYVFMDLSMPFMGGLEAALKFREQEESLQRGNKQIIVMMSATEIHRPDVFDLKLSKPINLNNLKSLLTS